MNVRMFGSFDGIPEMAKTPRKTPQRGWSPAIGSRTRGEDAKQVKCLIAQSRHNICAACLTEEAWRREPRPRVATFIRVLLEIERQLDAPSSAGERGSGRKPGPAGL
jgi:hypothetical protein